MKTIFASVVASMLVLSPAMATPGNGNGFGGGDGGGESLTPSVLRPAIGAGLPGLEVR